MGFRGSRVQIPPSRFCKLLNKRGIEVGGLSTWRSPLLQNGAIMVRSFFFHLHHFGPSNQLMRLGWRISAGTVIRSPRAESLDNLGDVCWPKRASKFSLGHRRSYRLTRADGGTNSQPFRFFRNRKGVRPRQRDPLKYGLTRLVFEEKIFLETTPARFVSSTN
jgi:hypothetical protein